MCAVYWVYKQILFGVGVRKAYLSFTMFGSKLCERGMLGSKNTIISREKQWPTSNLCSFQQMSTVQLSERAFCKDFKRTQQNQRVPRKIPRMRAALWENKQYVHISMASAAFVDFIT